MKILYVHNEYARPSGEEQAASELVNLLRENGHEVKWFTRSSAEISNSRLGKIKALLAGIYNPFSARKLAKVLNEYKPDIVQVQNLYPLLSSSIFAPIKKRKIPVVMRCPNYRLFCPQGLSLNPAGEICEKCWGGHEKNCIRYNCMGSKSKSIGYAIRNAFGRISKNIIKGVDVFIVQSDFQKNKFVSQGLKSEQIEILAGISPKLEYEDEANVGTYVSFIGRISPEKGIYEFIETARLNPDIPFKAAGNFDPNFKMPENVPENLEFVGFKKGAELDKFYADSRIVVVPSKWYEGFPNVIIRAMLHRKPVITCNIGAMQSIIDNDINGLLIPPGNTESLNNAINKLYYNKNLCRNYGIKGYDKASSLYSREKIYNDLLEIYNQAFANNTSN